MKEETNPVQRVREIAVATMKVLYNGKGLKTLVNKQRGVRIRTAQLIYEAFPGLSLLISSC